MSEPANAAATSAPEQQQTARGGSGVLPYQAMRALIAEGQIVATREIPEAQIQPASMDLRLGPTAYRVRGSFLPGPNATVMDKIERFCMHEIDLSDGAVLEKGCVYIVPLMESLRLADGIAGIANPKSSTGRLDIFTRTITDRSSAFERVRDGYQGPLYLEISPRSFSVVVYEGTRLNQLRLRRGASTYSDAAIRQLHEEVGLIDRKPGEEDVSNGLALSVDLGGTANRGLVGYRAKHHAPLIDVEKIGHYEPLEFWDPIHVRPGEGIFLNPDDFYILASKEAVKVPPDCAVEMVAYDTLVGEFRVHYAGFFDPGFGWRDDASGATRAVLEVRSHEVPFLLEDGQIVGRLAYDRLTEVPEKLYGADIGSSYQGQGLMLSKQFKRTGARR
ncbi:MAG: 2'-deoxycytidine 5'-triphosphate deaminase [Rhodospirillales bacterium]|nr:MAG: 2'-deoxycytidine 5'-triphosphate deaminase [Rhodospirillales bacterium]